MKRLLVMMMACGAPQTAPPETISSHVEPVQRTTAAPTISWHESRFDVADLPAVARGGEVVVVAASDGDGGRGFPNLRLEIRDRADKVIQRIPVMTSDEFEVLAPDGTPSPKLVARIDAANRELVKLHGVHDLVAMHALELQTPPGCGELPRGDTGLTQDCNDRHLAIGDGLDVDWNRDHVHVFHHNSDHPLVTLDGSRWLVPDSPMGGGTEICHNPAFLVNVFHAAAINAIVIELGFRGTDSCWEPGNAHHVISW